MELLCRVGQQGQTVRNKIARVNAAYQLYCIQRSTSWIICCNLHLEITSAQRQPRQRLVSAQSLPIYQQMCQTNPTSFLRESLHILHQRAYKVPMSSLLMWNLRLAPCWVFLSCWFFGFFACAAYAIQRV